MSVPGSVSFFKLICSVSIETELYRRFAKTLLETVYNIEDKLKLSKIFRDKIICLDVRIFLKQRKHSKSDHHIFLKYTFLGL